MTSQSSIHCVIQCEFSFVLTERQDMYILLLLFTKSLREELKKVREGMDGFQGALFGITLHGSSMLAKEFLTVSVG